MNFLAHLHLAEPTPESRLGNLLGDFVKGRPDDRFSPAIWEGIMLHRRVDVFTDRHPDWKRSRERLRPELRRFAGIVIDVFYDHFLARHWGAFSTGGESLDGFVSDCYATFERHRDWLPEETAAVVARMARQDWLRSYGEMAGIGRALDRLSRRSRRLKILKGSVAELEANYAAMEADFLAFYPDLRAFAEAERSRGL